MKKLALLAILMFIWVLSAFAQQPTIWFAKPDSSTTPIPVNHPVRTNSQEMINWLDARPGQNFTRSGPTWSASIWNANDPSLTINTLTWVCGGGCFVSRDVPPEWYANVPTPEELQNPGGSDSQIIIYNETTIWEFFGANVSDPLNPEFRQMTRRLRSESGGVYPSNPPFIGGIQGCGGTTMVEGTITREEWELGIVNHAIWFTGWAPVRVTGSYQRIYPCTGSMNGLEPLSPLKYGHRFQLNPAIDIDAIPGLTLGERGVLKAMQTYGVIYHDANCRGCTNDLRFESSVGKAWQWESFSSAWATAISWQDFKAIEPVLAAAVPPTPVGIIPTLFGSEITGVSFGN